jgi:hypothetical protein
MSALAPLADGRTCAEAPAIVAGCGGSALGQVTPRVRPLPPQRGVRSRLASLAVAQHGRWIEHVRGEVNSAGPIPGGRTRIRGSIRYARIILRGARSGSGLLGPLHQKNTISSC